MQKTLSTQLKLEGIGLHSGCKVTLTLNPAPVNHGIIFKRIDLPDTPQISALYSNVVDTRNCTCIGDDKGNRVSTIEHLMAALAVAGVDNALIEVDNQELPIMDGSAKQFFDVLSAPNTLQTQNAPRHYLKIKKEVSLAQDDKTITLRPADKQRICFAIDFPSQIVGHQEFCNEINSQVFADKISPCRTFCEKYQVDYLRSIGLAQGGSLDNAVVLDGDKLLNPEGFRCQNECVNHKVLDAIGDLYTSGYYIIGELQASRTGHYHTNELLKLLFADADNYEII